MRAPAAARLLAKYSTYLADKIRADIVDSDRTLATCERLWGAMGRTGIASFMRAYAASRPYAPSWMPSEAVAALSWRSS